jgi:hypothetical protein
VEYVEPKVAEAVAPVTLMDERTTASATVTAQVSVRDPLVEVKVIVALPAARAVTKPEEETLATVELELVQVRL